MTGWESGAGAAIIPGPGRTSVHPVGSSAHPEHSHA